MARPKKSDDEKLTEIVPAFRTNILTREKLSTIANSANISEPETLRRLIDGAPIVSSSVRSDPALVVALNRVGNNVNQLALSVHRDSAFQDHW